MGIRPWERMGLFVQASHNLLIFFLGQIMEGDGGHRGEHLPDLAVGEDVGFSRGEVVGIPAFEEPSGGPPVAVLFGGVADFIPDWLAQFQAREARRGLGG